MSENRAKCYICGREKVFIVWTPWEMILLFSPAKDYQLDFGSILICGNCKSRIMLMFREDDNCFEGCQNNEDLIETVRKELERWKR